MFLQSKPDMVFLQIGGNDAKEDNYKGDDDFKQKYQELINIIQKLPTKPKLTLMTNPPVLSCLDTKRPDIKLHREIANDKVTKNIRELGKQNNLDVLDIFELFGGNDLSNKETSPEKWCQTEKPEYDYADGFHYNIHQIAEYTWLYLEQVMDFD